MHSWFKTRRAGLASSLVVTATPRFLRSRSNHAAAARFYSGMFAFNQRIDFVINLELHWRAA
jgi:hypothetical protein